MSLGSKQYSASIAFTLALFSHLVNHVNIRLQAELEEAERQVPPLHTDATGETGNRFHFMNIEKKSYAAAGWLIFRKVLKISKSMLLYLYYYRSNAQNYRSI